MTEHQKDTEIHCTNCGKIEYTNQHTEPMNAHPPEGWFKYNIPLGYGRRVYLFACSDKCRIELEQKYKVDFIYDQDYRAKFLGIKSDGLYTKRDANGLAVSNLSNGIYKLFNISRY